ncbi:hypothetical protein M404DRAFT_291234 [Pisolithus tinctorius Marx 270]|uniref:Uncharacterized protein n=1 Tax=Pisolithus tinctorius Marx 270 TaxID=870435 RepID=A0A0C3IG89_PISTI|nr:hypothetical protein M404DRAFT_291234 [Pisolithus tinctorius Marx 270]
MVLFYLHIKLRGSAFSGINPQLPFIAGHVGCEETRKSRGLSLWSGDGSSKSRRSYKYLPILEYYLHPVVPGIAFAPILATSYPGMEKNHPAPFFRHPWIIILFEELQFTSALLPRRPFQTKAWMPFLPRNSQHS